MIGNLARDAGALTVAVVTKPFAFEGSRKARIADKGIEELRTCVDTLITVPNSRLLQMVGPQVSVEEAFQLADEALRHGVEGISDIINETGIINRDFADVETVMRGGGMALMGIGQGQGEHRAIEAAQQAFSSPLLEEASLEGAQRVLVNFIGGRDTTIAEINDAAEYIAKRCSPDCLFLFGYGQREELEAKIQVTVVATGFGATAEDRPARPAERATHQGSAAAGEAARGREPVPAGEPAERLRRQRGQLLRARHPDVPAPPDGLTEPARVTGPGAPPTSRRPGALPARRARTHGDVPPLDPHATTLSATPARQSGAASRAHFFLLKRASNAARGLDTELPSGVTATGRSDANSCTVFGVISSQALRLVLLVTRSRTGLRHSLGREVSKWMQLEQVWRSLPQLVHTASSATDPAELLPRAAHPATEHGHRGRAQSPPARPLGALARPPPAGPRSSRRGSRRSSS